MPADAAGLRPYRRLTGIARSTIGRGLKELAANDVAPPEDRIRRTGGGRKRATVEQPTLVKALLELIEGSIRGDPQADLL